MVFMLFMIFKMTVTEIPASTIKSTNGNIEVIISLILSFNFFTLSKNLACHSVFATLVHALA